MTTRLPIRNNTQLPTVKKVPYWLYKIPAKMVDLLAQDSPIDSRLPATASKLAAMAVKRSPEKPDRASQPTRR
jgi:hypothetical protein